MSIFKRLFNTDSANKAVDGVINGIDSAIFTDQERAQTKIKMLEALAPFKIVQRILAFAAALHWLVAGGNVMLAIWVKALTESRIDVVAPMLEYALSDYVLWPTLAVFSLYFSGGVIDSFKRGKE